MHLVWKQCKSSSCVFDDGTILGESIGQASDNRGAPYLRCYFLLGRSL